MMMKTTAAIAIAAASLFASTTFANQHHGEAKVACYGTNSCKGQSECKTKHHACKGMNDCSGKGMNMMTAKECHEKGGKLHEK